MLNLAKEVVSGAWSLLVGMGITAKHGFMKPTVTAHYPYEKLDVTPNYRGHIDLTMNKKTGGHKCISCMMCQRACPSDCIDIKAVKPEGAKKKQLVEYHLDFTKCSLCANCVEACPTNALIFSDEYNLVGTSRHDFHFELVSRLAAKAKELGIEPPPPKEEKPVEEKKEAPKAAEEKPAAKEEPKA